MASRFLFTPPIVGQSLLTRSWGHHVVAVVHLDEGLFIADVGLGDGPREPFHLVNQSWKNETGFCFRLEQRLDRCWRFENPSNVTGSLPGFSLDMSTRATPGLSEFQLFHRYYWCHDLSGFRSRSVAVHRILQWHRRAISVWVCHASI